MGRQFRFYLLPTDVDRLVSDLKGNVGVRLYSAKSPTAEIVEVVSQTSERSYPIYDGLLYCERCYLVPVSGSPIATKFIQQQGYWLVDSQSESIEFDGCAYRRDSLVQGRFYYQTDLLTPTGAAIVPKSAEFVKWAERVFRRAKKSLLWSENLDAYVGHDAAKWQQGGGQFFASHLQARSTFHEQ